MVISKSHLYGVYGDHTGRVWRTGSSCIDQNIDYNSDYTCKKSRYKKRYEKLDNEKMKKKKDFTNTSSPIELIL